MATDSQQTAGPALGRVVAHENGEQQKLANNPIPTKILMIMVAGKLARQGPKGNVAFGAGVCYHSSRNEETESWTHGPLRPSQMLVLPNTIFRYSKKELLDSFLLHGRIVLRPASYYKDSALSDAQQDDELARTSSLDTQLYQLAVGDSVDSSAQVLDGLFNITLRHQIRAKDGRSYDYYIFCTSLVHRTDLYPDFHADACVKIGDPEEFIRRLDTTCQREFGAYHLSCAAVIYFDADKPLSVKTNLELAFRKSRQKYSRQEEYRFAICLDPKIELSQQRSIDLGDLRDIAQYDVSKGTPSVEDSTLGAHR
jgi:hypothetical protein